jgi:peptide deformylase
MATDLDSERLARRAAAFEQIVQWGDPVLRSKASPVTSFDDALSEQVARMADLMDDALGAGLAAPQVGSLLRVFVYREAPDAPLGVVVNPRIVRASEETITTEEGCLSIGRANVWVPVERSEAVEVEAFDAKGRPITLKAEGREAVILQHETDHLDGVLMLSRTAPEHRREALRTLRELERGGSGQAATGR